MTGTDPAHVAAAVLLLLACAVAVLTAGGLGLRGDAVVAAGRALLQLTLVALVVAWVFTHPAGALLYLAVMLMAATVTSLRRIRLPWGLGPRVLASIGVGLVVTMGCVLLTGGLALDVRTLLPFAAQVIGGSMTAVSLAGTRMRDDIGDQWPQVEGWLALGATPAQSVLDIGRRAASRALIPALDQTRSAGLVVLPGAFVGMLLGGASPAQAGQVQLLVLVGLITAESCAVLLVTRLVGPALALHKP